MPQRGRRLRGQNDHSDARNEQQDARKVPDMRQEDRLGQILQQLNQHGTVAVLDLSSRLEVSEATVRRDLHLLEEQKLLTRTHGGAVASGVLYELPMRYRGGQH